MIKVSVIIPYYGERAALERCLEALERQTLDKDAIEVIVVNNRPDHKLTLSGGPSRLNITVVDEKSPGSYAARNRGVRVARGYWLAFTDADCIPDEKWLEAGLHQAARQEPLGGHILLLMKDPPSWPQKYDAAFGLNQKSYVEKSGFAATANLIVSKPTFDKVGPFSSRLRSGGDWEWCLRASRADYPVAYCPEAIVRHPARTTWREIVRKSLRVQGGMFTLERDFRIRLAPGAHRTWIDVFYPRRYVAKIQALKTSGDRSWLRLYLLACLVNALAVAETCRLRLGGTPLRL